MSDTSILEIIKIILPIIQMAVIIFYLWHIKQSRRRINSAQERELEMRIRTIRTEAERDNLQTRLNKLQEELTTVDVGVRLSVAGVLIDGVFYEDANQIGEALLKKADRYKHEKTYIDHIDELES